MSLELVVEFRPRDNSTAEVVWREYLPLARDVERDTDLSILDCSKEVREPTRIFHRALCAQSGVITNFNFGNGELYVVYSSKKKLSDVVEVIKKALLCIPGVNSVTIREPDSCSNCQPTNKLR